MRKHALVSRCLCLALLAIVLSACGRVTPVSAQTILGRWQVIDNKDITIPHSFFWFTMEYVEFRADGTVATFVHWPQIDGPELRLNKVAHYALTSSDRLALIGACRHQDPCTGLYTATLAGDELAIGDSVGRFVLKRVAGASEDLPLLLDGPLPSPTPVTTR